MSTMTNCRTKLLRKITCCCSETFRLNGHAVTKRQICLLAAVTTIVLLVYTEIYHQQRQSDIHLDRTSAIDTGAILFWTPFFGRDFAANFGSNPFGGCPVGNCTMTSDRRHLAQSQAVVFHIRDMDTSDMPPTATGHRDARQYWIFYLYESPVNTFTPLASLGNVFNWTMTYRLDSDVAPDLRTVPKKNGTGRTTTTSSTNHAGGKTKMAAWIVSNCWTHGHREKYVEKLRELVEVDVFGDCGSDGDHSDACRKDTPLPECYSALERRYKFYLSFENSVCLDYVTEKWYNVVQYDLVPVVFGGANYSRFAPAHSYIDVRDHGSPERLAAYLQLLDRNDTLYNEYFEWKRDFRVVGSQNSMCELCRKLTDAAGKRVVAPQSYVDIDGWWNNRCADILQLTMVPGSDLSKRAHYVVDKLSWHLQYFVNRLTTFF